MRSVVLKIVAMLVCLTLFNSCFDTLSVRLTKNRIAIPEQLEGYWLEGAHKDSNLMQVKKKDDYWAFVLEKNEAGDFEKVADLTMHKVGGQKVMCLLLWIDGKAVPMVMAIHQLTDAHLVLNTIKILSSTHESAFENASIDKLENIFYNYLKQGLIVVDKTDIVKYTKKYSTIKD